MTETLKTEVQAKSALAINSDWRQALDTALAGLADIEPDLLFVFASASYAQDLPALIKAAYQESGSRFLLGCSGLSFLIGRAQEVEDEKAISLLALTLPGVELFPTRLSQRDLVTMQQKGGPILAAQTGVAPGQVNGWVIFGDPFASIRNDCYNSLAKPTHICPYWVALLRAVPIPATPIYSRMTRCIAMGQSGWR